MATVSLTYLEFYINGIMKCVLFFFLGLPFTQHFKINLHDEIYQGASVVAQMIKNPLAKGRIEFNPWVRKIPWRKEWLPTPVFLPGESQGLGSLVGCRLWDRRVGHD